VGSNVGIVFAQMRLKDPNLFRLQTGNHRGSTNSQRNAVDGLA
jgi:hypothetical protein